MRRVTETRYLTHLATSFLLTIKLNTMNILTVLDFEDGKVYQYDIETDKELDTEDFEDIMIDQGHKLDDCEWMSHSDDTITKTKIEL